MCRLQVSGTQRPLPSQSCTPARLPVKPPESIAAAKESVHRQEIIMMITQSALSSRHFYSLSSSDLWEALRFVVTWCMNMFLLFPFLLIHWVSPLSSFSLITDAPTSWHSVPFHYQTDINILDVCLKRINKPKLLVRNVHVKSSHASKTLNANNAHLHSLFLLGTVFAVVLL